MKKTAKQRWSNVKKAAKTIRDRSQYGIRASVNIADAKTKGGTRKLKKL